MISVMMIMIILVSGSNNFSSVGWHCLSNATCLNTALFVSYGVTCLIRLIEFAALFATFQERAKPRARTCDRAPEDETARMHACMLACVHRYVLGQPRLA